MLLFLYLSENFQIFRFFISPLIFFKSFIYVYNHMCKLSMFSQIRSHIWIIAILSSILYIIGTDTFSCLKELTKNFVILAIDQT